MRRRLVTVLLALFAGLLAAPAVAAFAQPEGEDLHGTLEGPQGEPVEGVEITVTEDGATVGTATTASDGTWRVTLPGPGEYDVTLDVDTLPEGIVPRDEEDATLENVTVQSGNQQVVIFPLTTPEEAAEEDSTASPSPGTATPSPSGETGAAGWGLVGQVIDRFVAGVKFGAIIAITAIGLSLVFGTTKLINFAHGELVVVGATLAFFFNAAAAGPGLHLIPATVIAIVLGGLFGATLEWGLWRPLRVRAAGRIQLFIISIGLSLLLRHLVLLFFGSRPRPYAQYTLQQTMHFGPVSITPRDLAIVLISLAVLVAVGLMLQTTRIGKAMRAVADNKDLAESSGIDVNRVILVVWVFGGALAALGGVMFGLTEVVAWDMGFRLLLLMFAGVILGGLGTAYGAMVGSILVGLVAQMSTLAFPTELRNAWALGVMILVLLFRPQGIFGRAERVG